ncbi:MULTISPECIES: carbohydrate kinase family protein [Rhodanobacter]|uniref:Sugar kinase, ribokinase n=1 Tax=Rhodanobacter denitrificans TaxID=666685 RepID=I4WZK4_9GAMM|nr:MULTISPECIES: carbohydrate kinase [Rhodanobacter]AGG87850.1 sugar kinase, ribokinase [Rhodanobacter denitrificans]EIM04896.1 sugar kinase [Rhodanobacter denitrificans]KZC21463.1 fructokinase [Rhodanobacter denitrificans]UJJ51754.1 carbohydrate kinase [Rhodanobacter denitrificans]UJJ59470.1 carbohydrate kinase [Rhodanobacter denitrificans]
MPPRPILCFGEALIDLHADGLDPRGFAARFVPFAGGAPANVAVAAARLGGHARFAGMLARDRFGDFLLDSLQQAGVGTADVVRTEAANSALAFVTLDARGERSFGFYRDHTADLLFRPAHFRADGFRDVAVFHVCSNSMTDPALAATTREGMQRAHGAGALVSFDLNLRPALWPADADPHPLLWPALHLADVVKLSAEEFAWLAIDGEQAALDRLWLGRTRLVVVTDGARPLRWFHPEAEGELPCYAVETVDSTAAGDAFMGGLLCCLAELEATPDRLDRLVVALPRLHAMLRFAAACGALTVTRQGSFVAMPRGEEVLAFMERQA